MKQVQVSSEAVKTIVEFFNSIPGTPPSDVKAALNEMKIALSYVEPMGGEMRVGYCVIPKPGRNYLRSGHGAYSEAVVVSLNPFTVYSLDGTVFWEGALQDTLDVRAKMDEEEFKKILAIHNKPLSEMVKEVNDFCKTQVPIN